MRKNRCVYSGSLNSIRFHAVEYFALTEFSTVWIYTLNTD
jgi:hypothetical protein